MRLLVLSVQRAVFSHVPACMSMFVCYSYGLTSLLSRSASPCDGADTARVSLSCERGKRALVVFLDPSMLCKHVQM